MADMSSLLTYLALANQGQAGNDPNQLNPNQLSDEMNFRLGQQLSSPMTQAEAPDMKVLKTKINAIMPNPGPNSSLGSIPSNNYQANIPPQMNTPPFGLPFGPTKEQLAIEAEARDQAHRSMLDQAGNIQVLKNMEQGIAQTPNQVNFSPLAAYFDSIVPGSKLMSGYQPPETPEAKAQRVFDLQNKIQTAQNSLSKDQLQQLKDDISARQNGMSNAIMQRSILGQQRLAYQTDKEARQTMNNDPMLKLYTPRLEGAAKALELVNAAKKGDVTANQALLGQLNAEVSRLETGYQSPGLQAGEKTELNDTYANFVGKLNAAGIGLTHKPDGTAVLTGSVNPANINAIESLVRELGGSYKTGIRGRIDYLKSGMSPSQMNIADEKYNSLRKTYEPRLGSFEGQTQGPQASPSQSDGPMGKPKTVQQNGHTYILNEQTGQYE